MARVNTDDLITYTTAARLRGVKRQTIESLVRRGKLKAVLIDGQPFLLKHEVESYQAQRGGRPRKI